MQELVVAETTESWLNSYPYSDERYHELMDGEGQLRDHWRPLISQLQRLTSSQLGHRQDLLNRQILENGITYNVYADPKGADRPWELDLLPQVIAADEWAELAAGISQRAGLLDKVLADLYGPQQLLREGYLPPDLVFGHNNFLWPCHGITPPGGRFLHVYSADLARSPDGRWWVIADRTQSPSGAGYALENRQLITRALPELHRELRVRPVGGFFRALRNSLTELAPSHGETPLAVVLTPGRYNETYFEHLYLARQLGLPLVEGQDLTVRGDSLFLKTVGGLRRVHAVLRRLDDDFCDPLELRSDSALGVPGLLSVVRAGRVLVANALGSGVLESPGLLGFLPAISQRLLGEKLKLPQIATYWCGEPTVLTKALDRLPELVIKPAYPSQSFEPVFAARLDSAGRSALARRMKARPSAYVAQELVHLSQAPIWDGSGKLAARAIGMRVFAVATEDGYRVLPGGLTRVAHEADAGVVSMQRGGASKDTWVLAEGPVASDDLHSRQITSADIIRRDTHLPSRVVENLYWFGRYSERCDNQARLLRGALLRHIDNDGDENALTAALTVGERFGLLPTDGELASRLVTACLDGKFSNSLPANLQRLYSAAAPIRGRLSQENWQAVAALARQGRACNAADRDLGDALSVLNPLVTALTALSGFALDDMTRDVGWRFLMLGRRIERLQFFADAVASVLIHEHNPTTSTLEGLLLQANSLITYRGRYLTTPQLLPVLDLLLLDPHNPHSLMFQIEMIRRAIEQLVEEYAGLVENPLEQSAARLAALDLSALESSLFGDAGQQAAISGLVTLLGQLATAGGVLSERLALRYFAHADTAMPYMVNA